MSSSRRISGGGGGSSKPTTSRRTTSGETGTHVNGSSSSRSGGKPSSSSSKQGGGGRSSSSSRRIDEGGGGEETRDERRRSRSRDHSPKRSGEKSSSGSRRSGENKHRSNSKSSRDLNYHHRSGAKSSSNFSYNHNPRRSSKSTSNLNYHHENGQASPGPSTSKQRNNNKQQLSPVKEKSKQKVSGKKSPPPPPRPSEDPPRKQQIQQSQTKFSRHLASACAPQLAATQQERESRARASKDTTTTRESSSKSPQRGEKVAAAATATATAAAHSKRAEAPSTTTTTTTTIPKPPATMPAKKQTPLLGTTRALMTGTAAGGIKWSIHVDAPFGHCVVRLTLVKAIELYPGEEDDDSEEDHNNKMAYYIPAAVGNNKSFRRASDLSAPPPSEMDLSGHQELLETAARPASSSKSSLFSGGGCGGGAKTPPASRSHSPPPGQVSRSSAAQSPQASPPATTSHSNKSHLSPKQPKRLPSSSNHVNMMEEEEEEDEEMDVAAVFQPTYLAKLSTATPPLLPGRRPSEQDASTVFTSESASCNLTLDETLNDSGILPMSNQSTVEAASASGADHHAAAMEEMTETETTEYDDDYVSFHHDTDDRANLQQQQQNYHQQHPEDPAHKYGYDQDHSQRQPDYANEGEDEDGSYGDEESYEYHQEAGAAPQNAYHGGARQQQEDHYTDEYDDDDGGQTFYDQGYSQNQQQQHRQYQDESGMTDYDDYCDDDDQPELEDYSAADEDEDGDSFFDDDEGVEDDDEYSDHGDEKEVNGDGGATAGYNSYDVDDNTYTYHHDNDEAGELFSMDDDEEVEPPPGVDDRRERLMASKNHASSASSMESFSEVDFTPRADILPPPVHKRQVSGASAASSCAPSPKGKGQPRLFERLLAGDASDNEDEDDDYDYGQARQQASSGGYHPPLPLNHEPEPDADDADDEEEEEDRFDEELQPPSSSHHRSTGSGRQHRIHSYMQKHGDSRAGSSGGGRSVISDVTEEQSIDPLSNFAPTRMPYKQQKQFGGLSSSSHHRHLHSAYQQQRAAAARRPTSLVDSTFSINQVDDSFAVQATEREPSEEFADDELAKDGDQRHHPPSVTPGRPPPIPSSSLRNSSPHTPHPPIVKESTSEDKSVSGEETFSVVYSDASRSTHYSRSNHSDRQASFRMQRTSGMSTSFRLPKNSSLDDVDEEDGGGIVRMAPGRSRSARSARSTGPGSGRPTMMVLTRSQDVNATAEGGGGTPGRPAMMVLTRSPSKKDMNSEGGNASDGGGRSAPLRMPSMMVQATRNTSVSSTPPPSGSLLRKPSVMPSKSSSAADQRLGGRSNSISDPASEPMRPPLQRASEPKRSLTELPAPSSHEFAVGDNQLPEDDGPRSLFPQPQPQTSQHLAAIGASASMMLKQRAAKTKITAKALKQSAEKMIRGSKKNAASRFRAVTAQVNSSMKIRRNNSDDGGIISRMKATLNKSSPDLNFDDYGMGGMMGKKMMPLESLHAISAHEVAATRRRSTRSASNMRHVANMLHESQSSNSDESASFYSYGIEGLQPQHHHMPKVAHHNPYQLPEDQVPDYYEGEEHVTMTPFMQFSLNAEDGVKVVETHEELLEDEMSDGYSIDEFVATGRDQAQPQTREDLFCPAELAESDDDAGPRGTTGSKQDNNSRTAAVTPTRNRRRFPNPVKMPTKQAEDLVKRFFKIANSSFGSSKSDGLDLEHAEDGDGDRVAQSAELRAATRDATVPERARCDTR